MTTGKLDGEPVEAGWPDWLSGVRQSGAQLSAAPHRSADRPELSLAKRRWRFAFKEHGLSRRGCRSSEGGQLNTLQTVIPSSYTQRVEENMVKPHG
jgi:hypothetical protein